MNSEQVEITMNEEIKNNYININNINEGENWSKESINFINNLEDQIYQNIKSKFNQYLPSFPNTQIDNFKKDFWYNDGIPKIWNKKTINQI